MIKTVIFDLDGTLYDYDAAHSAGYQCLRQYASTKLSMDGPAFDTAYQSAMTQIQQTIGVPNAAIHDRYLRFQVLLENAGLPLAPHVWDLTTLYWNTLMDAMIPSPGMSDCISVLKRAGYRLGIGTNMQVDYQLLKLERLGVISYFDFIVTSEEAFVEKPNPRFFLCCVQKARCAPEECLFVGDDLELDILGAQKAELQTLWFQPNPTVAALHPDIPSIQDFKVLQEKLCVC